MTAKRPLLIVEDDAELRETLVDSLTDERGFACLTAATLQEADTALATEDARFDAIILDIGLPDGDGRDYCARLRRQGHRMPILILTGAGGEDNIVRGLESGANDYISKPFRSDELVARLHAQLRLFDGTEDAVFSVGPFIFQPGKKLLRDPTRKSRIHLTGKETSLLKFLYRAAGRVDRQVLLNEVWGYNSGANTHTLETHIYRLRQKLEVNAMTPSLLVTEDGGYSLRPAA